MNTLNDPQKLIEQLDELANSGKYAEIALWTEEGGVFSWHTHKLKNLTGSMQRHGRPLGFIGVSGDPTGETHVTFWTVDPNDAVIGDDFSSWRLGELLDHISSVVVVWHVGRLHPDEEFGFICDSCGDFEQSPFYCSDCGQLERQAIALGREK